MSKSKFETKHDITPQYREELKEAFNMFDKDGSGSISAEELAIILKNLNQNYHDDGILFLYFYLSLLLLILITRHHEDG